MRKKLESPYKSNYKIFLVDDEPSIVESLSYLLRLMGYHCSGTTDPFEAIRILSSGEYDLLILDYIMEGMCGDKVVEKIREFNKEIYILLLTGHKDIAPPVDTLKKLDIQGYCEKSDRLDQLQLFIESAIKSITQMHTIKRFKDGLNKVLEFIPKIYQLQPVTDIQKDVLTQLIQLIDGNNGFLLIDDFSGLTNNQRNTIYSGIGKFDIPIEDLISMIDASLMEQIGLARTVKKSIRLEDSAVFPLINEHREAFGIIYVENIIDEEGMKLIEIFSKHASLSIINAFLHSLVNIKNEELNKTYEDLKARYFDTIEALRLTVDAKDVYTRGHSDRVAYYAVEIGKTFGLPQHELETLRVGGIFHDLGKIGTTDDILLKSEKLSPDEYDEIKKHPIIGSHILSAISMFSEVVPLVRHHHERIDGGGYPDKLKGDEIPFLSRILSVADAFDSMTSNRKYRSKLDMDDARKQLVYGSGSQFDVKVVEKFMFLLDETDLMVI